MGFGYPTGPLLMGPMGNSLCSLVSCQMVQIFSRWRCGNWVSVFKIIFFHIKIKNFMNYKKHYPKNHPKNLWVCNRIWQVKKSWIIQPSTLNNGVVAKMLKKYFIFTWCGGLHYSVSPILSNWSGRINFLYKLQISPYL